MIGWSSSGSGRRCPGRTLEGQAAVLLPAAQFRVIFLNTGQAVGNTHTQETWWVPGYGHLSLPQMWAWSPTELVPEWPLPLGRRRSLRQLHPWGSRCSVPPLGGEEVARGTTGRLPPPGCHQPGQVGSPHTHTHHHPCPRLTAESPLRLLVVPVTVHQHILPLWGTRGASSGPLHGACPLTSLAFDPSCPGASTSRGGGCRPPVPRSHPARVGDQLPGSLPASAPVS